jgi:7-carboxy-7-deazaguanine synthase
LARGCCITPVLTVNEVFFSIQGEGTRAGQPCVFVRLTGCPLRCTWCDTSYAFHEGTKRAEEDVLEEIRRYPCRLVLLTGGEPLSQPAAFPFVTRLADGGWQVLVETSGHVPLDGLDPRASAVMDVKAPGSGETHRMEWRNLDLLSAKDEVKLVLADRGDYEWARELVRDRRLDERCPVLFAPVHGRLDPGELGRWILDDGLPVRLQVQLHKYLWPGAERGV